MCSSPKAPPPPAPLPPAPAPEITAIDTGAGSRSTRTLTANRGRSSLRIDRTQSLTGSSGNGLNIPS